MGTSDQDYAAWAGLVTELDEAREHLAALIEEMVKQGRIDDATFEVQLGHIYAHLNRVWHSRNQTEEIGDAQWVAFTEFPRDLKPIG
jgi:hypothetical protein